jgi:Carboxypeptidase regulatory-like domain
MKRVVFPLAAAFAALLLLAAAKAAPSATDCLQLPPLKPLHRVCGVVFFVSGDRVPNARVSVLQGDEEVAAQMTDAGGHFSFDQLKPGKYELRILVRGVPGGAGTKIVLVHPNANSKQEIAVNINLSVANCSSFSLVNAKKFEARLNPSDPE